MSGMTRTLLGWHERDLPVFCRGENLFAMAVLPLNALKKFDCHISF